MSANIYLDFKGKEIEKEDRVHYSTKNGIAVGRVVDVLNNEDGVKIIGVGKKRACVIKNTEKQIIVDVKGYYVDHKRAKRTGRA